MGASYFTKTFDKKDFTKSWKEFVTKEKQRIINDFGKTYKNEITKKNKDWYLRSNQVWKKISFKDVIDFGMYHKSPCSWNNFKLNKTFINKEFQKSEIDEFIKKTHQKWDAGLVIPYKNKFIVGGWVAE